MIEPYNAVGLIPTFWGIRRRADIQKNIDHLKGVTKAAFWLSNLDIPVRLLAIPEGALMGFNASLAVAALFVASMGTFVFALLSFLAEIRVASNALESSARQIIRMTDSSSG